MNQPLALSAAQATPSFMATGVAPRSPLVPVALAVGVGIGWERLDPLPAALLMVLLMAVVAGWFWALRRQALSSVIWLWVAASLLAMSWHRVTQLWPADAIGHFATADRTLVQVRGVVAEDVIFTHPRRPELYSLPKQSGRGVWLLQAKAIRLGSQWQPVSGLVRVSGDGDFANCRLGKGVEVIGVINAMLPPLNPGGRDGRRMAWDQGIQATLQVKSDDAVRSYAEGDQWSISLLFAQMRAVIRQTFNHWLPQTQAGVAQALLCGESSALTPDQSEGYLQTGVYHVLAVSGQHLVVLCAFVGVFLRFSGGSLRIRAVSLALFVIAYTLLTGAGPAVVRAAVIVCAWCGALWLGRTTQPLNSLALAWIVVAILQPSDLAGTGCLLSFAAVWILILVISPWHRWTQERQTPLDKLEARLRPTALKVGYWTGNQIRWAFLIALVVWVGTAPLVAGRFHLISPVAILIGPLLSLFMMGALILGFLLVLLSGVPLLAPGLAFLLNFALAGGDTIVHWGRHLPWGYGYCPDLPDWWIGAFYVGLIGVTLLPLWWRNWKVWTLIALGWLLLGIALCRPQTPEGLRVTILAVGHGTAVVMETPDGRCYLYDAGSLAGPEAAQRHVASYLWSREQTKIDEVLISHADLDHFNALPDLADRFRIGKVRTTPTFGEKPNLGTRATLKALRQCGIRMATATQGMELVAGDMKMEVLHPPAHGPVGVENVRSLVLRIAYEGKSVLLTGDLEKEGLAMVLARPIEQVDVLVAPHHGSSAANTDLVADWCRPKLVISSETIPRGPKPDPYSPLGATLWRTWIHGGATVEINATGIRAWTHFTGQHWTTDK